MKTILLTWNPSRWEWEDLPEAVVAANQTGSYNSTWSCGVARSIDLGDRAFLMRLGVSPKGLIGSGFVTKRPFEDLHWSADTEDGKTAFYVSVEFDVLSEEPIIGESELSRDPFAEQNWFPQASGNKITPNVAALLEKAWVDLTGSSPVQALPDISAEYREGARIQRPSYAYERNAEAREECLKAFGYKCKICDFDFRASYGALGRKYIQVHHLKPLSTIGSEYSVNPLTDLIPICPNCHAMIHRRVPALTIDELRQTLRHFA